LIVATTSAQAAEIHALITTAMKAAIDELVPKFERKTALRPEVSHARDRETIACRQNTVT